MKSGEENLAKIGRALKEFRNNGCLIMGSGSISHNLQLVFKGKNKKY